MRATYGYAGAVSKMEARLEGLESDMRAFMAESRASMRRMEGWHRKVAYYSLPVSLVLSFRFAARSRQRTSSDWNTSGAGSAGATTTRLSGVVSTATLACLIQSV